MGKYRTLGVEQLKEGGFEARINGPGIPVTGVVYWFASETEAHSFIENLNLSYVEGKRLLKRRKALLEPMKAAAAH